MFLNDLSNKTRRFTKVNHWLNKEFGVSVNENSTIDQLSNAKVNLENHKQRLTESSQFNEGHKDKHYMKTIFMLEAVDMLLASNGSIVSTPVSMIAEQTDEMENAQILLAAQDMVDKLAGMAEDLAELQTKALMPLVDEIKYNVGQQQAQSFNDTAKAQLQSALDAISSVKDAMGDQVLALQGGQLPASDMEEPMPEIPGMEEPMPEIPGEEMPPVEDTEDMLGGADEVAGPADSPLGREEK
jgi:hypothetical protein